MNKNSRVLVTGSGGLVGSALAQHLREQGYENTILHTREACDLTDLTATVDYFAAQRPSHVFHTAGTVYGIMGSMNNRGRSFFENTLINTHVVEACRRVRVEKIAAMGSGCVYPYPPPSLPLREDTVFFGRPHHSEDAYAHAKRAMLAQLEAYAHDSALRYAFVISGNLFGPRDTFDVAEGHVTPALIKKFFDAKQTGQDVIVWGDGSAQRDFLYSADAAAALEAIMHHVEGPVNMGSGRVNRIRDIVDILAEHTGLSGRVRWDESKPNGQEYREYDLTRLFATGFSPRLSFSDAIRSTYDWFSQNNTAARVR